MPCKIGVVYHVPLKYGKCNVRQAVCCVNYRLKEHESSLSDSKHLLECKLCDPIFNDTTILATHRDKRTCEIIEALCIAKKGPAVQVSPQPFCTRKKLTSVPTHICKVFPVHTPTRFRFLQALFMQFLLCTLLAASRRDTKVRFFN